MTLALVDNPTPIQTVIGLNEEAIAEWIEYRKEKKKPLSPLALKKSQKFLLKYGESEQQRIVDHCIMNDWQGLHYVDPPRTTVSTKHTSLADDLNDTSWAH